MAIYTNKSQLGRIKLPSGTEYALVDVDGRLMLAPNFSTEASYSIGDHVLYDGPQGAVAGCNLYRFKVDHSAGEWNSQQVDLVTVDSEIKRLEGLIAGGIHYRGKTVTPLYDGATTNPISIGGTSYTAESGDMVILDLTSQSAPVSAYAINTAYLANTYIKNDGIVYIVKEAITALENTNFRAIEEKLGALKNEPEFLFDGST